MCFIGSVWRKNWGLSARLIGNGYPGNILFGVGTGVLDGPYTDGL